MFARVRLLHLALIAAGTAAGLWVLAPAPLPAPPDFTGAGFVAVHAAFRGPLGDDPLWRGGSSDARLVAGFVELLREGRPVPVCRCGAMGSVTLERANGTREKLLVMPAHDPGSVEFRFGVGRFRVDRARFLRLVEPLGVPPERWFRSAGMEELPHRDPAVMAVVGGVLGADRDGLLWYQTAKNR